MFDLSDDAAAEIETRGSRPQHEEPWGGHMPAMSGFGDDQPPEPLPGPGLPPLPAPLPAPDDSALRSGAGRTLLWVSGGLVIGAVAGGAFGAAAGVVVVGALRNALRVKDTWNSPDPDARSEAGKSATMAIFGLGIAGMLGYQAYQRKKNA